MGTSGRPSLALDPGSDDFLPHPLAIGPSELDQFLEPASGLEKGVRQVEREGAVALLPDLEIVDYSISKPIAPTANSGGGEPPAKSLADWWHTLPYRAAGFLPLSKKDCRFCGCGATSRYACCNCFGMSFSCTFASESRNCGWPPSRLKSPDAPRACARLADAGSPPATRSCRRC